MNPGSLPALPVPAASTCATRTASLPLSRRQVLAVATGTWLAACTLPPPLRITGHPWPGYEPLFLARDMGWLPEQVQLLESPTLQASVQRIRSGGSDAIMLTLDEMLALRDQGHALQAVLVFNVSRGADMLLGRPSLRSLADLRGQRIGVEDGVLGTLMLTLALERAGLRRHEVKVHRIAYERHEAAWQGHEIDALITYEPVGGRLMASGARQLLSTRQLPDTIFDVLAAPSELPAHHARTLGDALAAHFRALTHLRQNPWDAAYRLAPRLHVSAEAFIESLRGLELPDLVGNQRYLAASDSPLLQAAVRIGAVMRDAGLLKHAVNPGRLLTADYLPRA
jgi:NitT/TauT family transport system substrate-binding protein